MTELLCLNKTDSNLVNEDLFEIIASNISTKGYSINFNALPVGLSESLWMHLQQMNSATFVSAGIGRESGHQLNQFIRSDEICWINGDSEAGSAWLEWTKALQIFLNRRLFLGLFSFESHFAHYAPGAFYKKHLDAFKGESNRRLSLVFYLNPGWLPEDGGELRLYTGQQNHTQVVPGYGTLVTFLSEDFPHEVLAARRDRYSIAGWFRVNGSTPDKADPPR